jgi:hypothetical protein
MSSSSGATQSRMARLSRWIEGWRLAGRRGKRMPAALWEEAAELAEELGSYRVSRELGLSYASLRGRVRSRAGDRGLVAGVRGAAVSKSEPEPVAMGGFAEVDLGAVFGSRQGSAEIEIARGDGARMQIRVPLGSGKEIAAIVSAFVGEAS